MLRSSQLVERKGELSLVEEQNAMTTARRESTFRMSKLRNGFVSGSLERQPGVGRRSSKAGWGDFEGGAAKKKYLNTSNFNVTFSPKAKSRVGKAGGTKGGGDGIGGRRWSLVMAKTPKSNADVFFGK